MVDRELVRRSVDAEDLDEFHDRVERQAAFLKDEIKSASLDNDDPTIGLEIEVYAVDQDDRLSRVPDDVFGDRLSKELGLHNAEINTRPAVLDGDGLADQRAQIASVVEEADRTLEDQGLRLVFDSMWTIPPDGSSHDYLGDVDREEDLTVARNMRNHPRYRAIDNAYLDRAGEVSIELPGVDEDFPSILPESLATSIQPHLQVPDADRLPSYYNAAIRTMPIVLSLTTNSPFVPPDLYGDVGGHELLEETYHELRVPVFEQSVNLPGEDRPTKVRFPEDIDAAEDAVEGVVEDHTYSPFLQEWTDENDDAESYTDEFWEFDFKRGTYWRWLRAVIGGQEIGEGNDERSIRLEYRPVPTQPSVADNVAVLALVAGLVVGIVDRGHPLAELPWEDAERSFYDAVERGPDAEIAWIDGDGDRTTDRDRVLDEVFGLARDGLVSRGVADDTIGRLLAPLEARRGGRTPSTWKIARVEERLDGGDGLEEAIHGMQQDYITASRRHDGFADWPQQQER